MITQLGVKPQHSLAKRLVSKVAVVVVTTMSCQCEYCRSTVLHISLAPRQVLITPWSLSCTQVYTSIILSHLYLLIVAQQPKFLQAICRLWEGGGSSQSRPVMNRGQLPTNQLHDINLGALDHASRAPKLMPCNYYVHTYIIINLIKQPWLSNTNDPISHYPL